jgi:hypothetical protein
MGLVSNDWEEPAQFEAHLAGLTDEVVLIDDVRFTYHSARFSRAEYLEDIPSAYTLASNGTMQAGALRSLLSKDGGSYVLVDEDLSDQNISLCFGIRKSSGLSNAVLQGRYIMTELGVDPDHWTGRIEVEFDGQGGMTWRQIKDSNQDTASGSWTYSVAEDGLLSIDGKYVGIVGSKGELFSLVDADRASEDQTCFENKIVVTSSFTQQVQQQGLSYDSDDITQARSLIRTVGLEGPASSPVRLRPGI